MACMKRRRCGPDLTRVHQEIDGEKRSSSGGAPLCVSDVAGANNPIQLIKSDIFPSIPVQDMHAEAP